MKKIISCLCIISLICACLIGVSYSQESSDVQIGNFETTLMLSLVFPGLGQIYNKQITKGAIFAGATVSSLVLSIIMYNTANQIYEDYKATGDPYHPKYDDYLSYITMTNVFLVLTGVIWATNLVDAYFVASKNKRQSFNLEIEKNKIMLSFKTKF